MVFGLAPPAELGVSERSTATERSGGRGKLQKNPLEPQLAGMLRVFREVSRLGKPLRKGTTAVPIFNRHVFRCLAALSELSCPAVLQGKISLLSFKQAVRSMPVCREGDRPVFSPSGIGWGTGWPFGPPLRYPI